MVGLTMWKKTIFCTSKGITFMGTKNIYSKKVIYHNLMEERFYLYAVKNRTQWECDDPLQNDAFPLSFPVIINGWNCNILCTKLNTWVLRYTYYSNMALDINFFMFAHRRRHLHTTNQFSNEHDILKKQFMLNGKHVLDTVLNYMTSHCSLSV